MAIMLMINLEHIFYLTFFFQIRENREDLAPLLWDSFGTIALLLQVGYAIWLHIQWMPSLSNRLSL